MTNDYVPPPRRSSAGCVVGVVLAVILIPLVLCGLGVLGFFYSWTELEVQPQPIQEQVQPIDPVDPQPIEPPAEQPEPPVEPNAPEAAEPMNPES